MQLTEGAGDNTFGGFLSPDDKSLYYVKNDRTLLEVNLTTLQEREVYRVADDWVGYGTWVANSDCTKLVGIEIAKATGRRSTTGRFSMISSTKAPTAACCASTCKPAKAA